jgi:hypothetical protein
LPHPTHAQTKLLLKIFLSPFQFPPSRSKFGAAPSALARAPYGWPCQCFTFVYFLGSVSASLRAIKTSTLLLSQLHSAFLLSGLLRSSFRGAFLFFRPRANFFPSFARRAAVPPSAVAPTGTEHKHRNRPNSTILVNSHRNLSKPIGLFPPFGPIGQSPPKWPINFQTQTQKVHSSFLQEQKQNRRNM